MFALENPTSIHPAVRCGVRLQKQVHTVTPSCQVVKGASDTSSTFQSAHNSWYDVRAYLEAWNPFDGMVHGQLRTGMRA